MENSVFTTNAFVPSGSTLLKIHKNPQICNQKEMEEFSVSLLPSKTQSVKNSKRKSKQH